MPIGKRVLLVLSSAILFVLLVLTGLSVGLRSSFGDPDTIKSGLEGSGIYSAARDHFLSEAVTKATPGTEQNLITNPLVQSAIKESFPPELVKENSEAAVDEVYRWLRGDVGIPDIRFDLREARLELIDRIAATIKDRMNSLPACTNSQLLAMDRDNIDPFTLECRPPGIDIDQEAARISQELTGDERFLGDGVLTLTDLQVTQSGEPAFPADSQAPAAFQRAMSAVWPLSMATLITAFALVLLRRDRLKGLGSIGWIALGAALFLAACVILPLWLLSRIGAPDTAGPLQPALAESLKAIAQDYNRSVGVFAAAIGGAGVMCISTSFALRHRHNSGQVLPAPHEDTPTIPAEDIKIDSNDKGEGDKT